MATITRVNSVLVSNGTGSNTGTSLSTIVDGDILIFNKNFDNLTGSPTITSDIDNDIIYIAMGIGTGEYKLSAPIQVRNIRKVQKEAYAAPVQQVTHIGFAGSGTEDIDVENDTEYQLNIKYKDVYRVQPQRPTIFKYNFVSSSAATKSEVVSAMVRKVNADSNIKVSAVILSNNAGTAITGTGTISIANGSKTITAGTDIDAVLQVGDYIRLGSTAVTGGVYKIVSMDTSAQTAELDTYYQGPTLTANAEANHQYISAANFELSNVGIQLTGETLIEKSPDLYAGVLGFEVSMFPEIGTHFTVTETTSKNDGQGFWKQVRDREYFAQANEGITNRIKFPTNVPPTKAASGNQYASLIIEHADIHTGDRQNTMSSPLTTEIYINTSGGTTTKYDAVVNILESLIESAGIFVE
ncbi:MAG TPA: hypothetical protein VIK84_01630 [Haloplasmataceae bacterium]